MWAIVLAGGEGTRLRSLTDDGAGNAVPKQFCSVSGGESLLAQTLARARSIVDCVRIVTIVSAAHAQYWRSSVQELPPGNIIVQPANRGTAIGILLPVLAILQRDPHARLLILPSDHYVADEAVLASAIGTAFDALRHQRRGVALLGMVADEPDPELGYIVAEAAGNAAFQDVRRFVEKPTIDEAMQLCEDGAMWNSFIVACRAESLIELYRSRCPDAVEALQGIELRNGLQLADAYHRLPRLDFSRQIATGQEERLAVVPVPHCGWNDLGTPKRLAQTLVRHPKLLTDKVLAFVTDRSRARESRGATDSDLSGLLSGAHTMTMSKKDLGIAQVLLQQLNEQRLPHALKMKDRVDKGELLTDYDQEFLKRVAEEARYIPALLLRQPQYTSLATQVFALFEHITAKGLENEKASASAKKR